MLVRQINDEFTYTGNGNYERVNRSRFQINPSFGVDAVLKIGDLKKYRYGLMLGYEFGVQLPFSELSSVLPLNQLKIGMRLENIDHTSN